MNLLDDIDYALNNATAIRFGSQLVRLVAVEKEINEWDKVITVTLHLRPLKRGVDRPLDFLTPSDP